MRLEALAIGGKVVRTGMGHVRARAAAHTGVGASSPGAAVVLAGISGGLDPTLRPGEIVVATIGARTRRRRAARLAEADAAAVAST